MGVLRAEAEEADPLQWAYDSVRLAIPDITHLDIRDVSNGHTATGFTDGSQRSLNPKGLELRIVVVSMVFEGKKLLQRQRLVNKALQAELHSGLVHSLPFLKTWTPSEWQAKSEE